MRKRKKLNEWCHAATCLRVSLAGKDVLQRFFDITQEDYFTQMEKENPLPRFWWARPCWKL